MAVVVLQHAPAGAPSAVGAALEAARLEIRVYRAGGAICPRTSPGSTPSW
ncbi:hypothetical protein [Streptomyces sp. NPDC048357]